LRPIPHHPWNFSLVEFESERERVIGRTVSRDADRFEISEPIPLHVDAQAVFNCTEAGLVGFKRIQPLQRVVETREILLFEGRGIRTTKSASSQLDLDVKPVVIGIRYCRVSGEGLGRLIVRYSSWRPKRKVSITIFALFHVIRHMNKSGGLPPLAHRSPIQYDG
jgi:hypothetical protein